MMLFRALLASILICGWVPPLNGQEDIKAALRGFIALTTEGDSHQKSLAESVLTGEALQVWRQHPLTIDSNVFIDTIVTRDQHKSIARLTAHGGRGEVNYYIFLERSPEWKIFAIRTLPQRVILERALALATQRAESEGAGDPAGRAAYYGWARVCNLRLTLASDVELVEWFRVHKPKLEQIVSMARHFWASKGVSILEADSIEGEMGKYMRELCVQAIKRAQDGRVDILIGGILDNTVGFMFFDNGKPPEIDPSSYIWIQRVSGRWYLFRTV